MNKLEIYMDMLKEFDYKKNGKELTLYFLTLMVELIEKLDEDEWK